MPGLTFFKRSRDMKRIASIAVARDRYLSLGGDLGCKVQGRSRGRWIGKQRAYDRGFFARLMGGFSGDPRLIHAERGGQDRFFSR